jgi:hypothetical protein
MAKRSSMRTVSQAIMSKTEAALGQFKADYKGYPYQLNYSQDGDPWTNSLGYNVGTDISTANQALVKSDMIAAAGDYGYDLSSWMHGWGPTRPASIQAFTDNRNNGISSGDQNGDPEGDDPPISTHQDGQGNWYWNFNNPVATCVLLNRLGAERANEIMLIGDVTGCGVLMQPIGGPGGLLHHGRDLSTTPLLKSPKSLNQPGWAKDYLQGLIDAKYLRGTAILDAYLHPLIYICQVVPGTESSFGEILNSPVDINTPWYNGLEPLGRATLEPLVPGTSTPITGNPVTLPDPSNLMHSDMRFWAPPGYELEFELWSAGPDGQMSWWRDDLANRDNVPCEPYNKSIGTMP